ncbi:MAG: 23S rRNA (guanosine(2251)-2'-O)-methyltransferase RlmB [Christensenellaceae bacterium]|nr:23S rRNA (guanosine(2251)-2'-O)-methyltransferase RlmB [Christensenellaceae bacterium]
MAYDKHRPGKGGPRGGRSTDFKGGFAQNRGARPQGGRPFDRDARPQGGRPFDRDARPQGGRPFDRDERPRPRYDGPGPRRAQPPRYAVPPSTQVYDAPAQPEAALPPEAAPRSFEPAHPEMPENLLVGRNPIREALKAGRPIEKLLVASGELTGSAREIVAMAREQRVVVQYVDRVRLDQVYPNHQGMLAYASAAEYASVEEILELAKARDEDAFVVVLDGLTDPHNLGAIIRSAECMGAHGVIIPERRSAGLNPAAVKASAGALSHIKVARVVNLTRTLNELKEKGLWITGAVTDGAPVADVGLNGPIALVIGSEGEGISQLCLRQCDQRVKLPLYGQIESLNASVAAGILLYEIAKARHGA